MIFLTLEIFIVEYESAFKDRFKDLTVEYFSQTWGDSWLNYNFTAAVIMIKSDLKRFILMKTALRGTPTLTSHHLDHHHNKLHTITKGSPFLPHPIRLKRAQKNNFVHLELGRTVNCGVGWSKVLRFNHFPYLIVQSPSSLSHVVVWSRDSVGGSTAKLYRRKTWFTWACIANWSSAAVLTTWNAGHYGYFN